MKDWILLLIAAIIGSIVSLIGGIYLLYGRKGAEKIQKFAVPFAAGSLLAASFVDLLPEAFEHGDVRMTLYITLAGFVGFFFLERFLQWFHHHHEDEERGYRHRSTISLVVIGDTVHNFIDGLAIGASFLVNPATGFVTAFAVAAHEIPQEIGDFGLLLSKGMSKKNVFLVNFYSALSTIVAAVMIYAFGGVVTISEPFLLAITAGFFIYIAASDIIPSIHAEDKPRTANLQAVVLLLAILFIGCTTLFMHQFMTH